MWMLDKIASIVKSAYVLRVEEGRCAVIDAWKGVLIFLVIIEHAWIDGFFSKMILSFHMPAFFIISGYMMFRTCCVKKYTRCARLKSRFKRLFVPYLCFICMHAAMLCVYDCNKLDSDTLKAYFYWFEGGGMWFLPCLFLSDLIVFVLIKYTSKNVILACFAVGLYLLSYGVDFFSMKLPFMLDVSLMGSFYVLMGYILAPYIFKIECLTLIRMTQIMLCVVLLIVVGFVSYFNSPFLMFMHECGNYALAFCGAISGAVFILLLSTLLYHVFPRMRKILMWMGRNSLLLYGFHILISKCLYSFAALGVQCCSSSWLKLLIFLIVLVPLCNLISKYVPIMAGVYRQTTK